MKCIFTTIYLLNFITVYAQLHDNFWVFDNADTMFQVDFRGNVPDIGLKHRYLDFGRAHSVFCDGNGELLYYTDCRKIFNKQDSLVENGDSLNFGYTYNGGINPVQNGSFFLPAPGDSTKCYFIYMRPEKYTPLLIAQIQLQYALIDMTANNGLGKVIEKEVPLLNGGVDTTNFIHPTAVRHANGRDWWILVPDRMEPKYYRMLLTPQGFSQPQTQVIGFKVPGSDPYGYLGYTKFSPDGTRLAELSIRQKILAFYDFDRCTGLLSNPTVYYNPVNSISNILAAAGIAFSSSGKRFYLSYFDSDANRILQYDMEAADFLNSVQVLFDCPIPSSVVECSIDKIVLAPDGKLYLDALIDKVGFHVIHMPDSLGAACDFRFGELRFPADFPQTEPTDFPNFRLGPIDGSTCDTLGINNLPVAWFFWEADELKVDFSNASYHEPDSYLWDYGDPASGSGNTSTEANPFHTYPAPGTYTACLTASNAYGSHTFCRQVTVDTLPPEPVLPVPAFTWDAVELAVNFINNSSSSDSFLWDFGDPASGSGNASTEADPVHTYPAPGSYNTCLTASNAYGSSTFCQLVIVDTLPDPVLPSPAFTWDAAELEVGFCNNSTNSPDSFLWVFGDLVGTSSDTSIQADPVHTYSAPGSYNTCLTASNAYGSNTLCQLVTVDTLLDSVSLVAQRPVQRSVSLQPNPAASDVNLVMDPPFAANASLTFFDVLGRRTGSFKVLAGQSMQQITLDGFADGMYFYEVRYENCIIQAGKLVKAE